MYRSIAFIALVLAACTQVPNGGGSGIPPTSSTALPDGDWSLVELNGRVVPRGTTLEFSEGVRIGGEAPCNRYFGNYRAASNATITLSGIGATQRACPALQLEAEYISTLGRVAGYRQGAGGRTLVLLDGNGTIAASYDRAATVSSMLEGDWRITAVNTGLGIESAPGLDGTGLTFRRDGTFSGNLGCNAVNGAYSNPGDSLSFDNTLVTARACPGAAPYENAIREALNRVSRVSRRSDGLTLQDAGGMTLIELAR